MDQLASLPPTSTLSSYTWPQTNLVYFKYDIRLENELMVGKGVLTVRNLRSRPHIWCISSQLFTLRKLNTLTDARLWCRGMYTKASIGILSVSSWVGRTTLWIFHTYNNGHLIERDATQIRCRSPASPLSWIDFQIQVALSRLPVKHQKAVHRRYPTY